MISCEGAKREPEYFEYLVRNSRRVRVEIIKPDPEVDGGSDPRSTLDRACRHIAEKNDLGEDDEFWLVIDEDSWEKEDIHETIQHCQDNKGWDIAVSNPCFELWLLLHTTTEFFLNEKDCKELKTILGDETPSGYSPQVYIPLIPQAIINAKSVDKYPNHAHPDPGTTKVYQLVERLMQRG